VIAASRDPIEKLAATTEKDRVSYTLMSDPGLAASRQFGIVFRLDPTTLARYREAGIELDGDQLPVPAVFVIDAEGKILFSYANPDYRVRLDTRILMAAAAAAVDK